MQREAGEARRDDHALTRHVGWVLAIVACCAIAYATLTPRAGISGREGYAAVCVICDGTPGVDLIANILLFVPLGVGLTLAGMRPVRALLLMAAMTTTIELAQIRLVVGRDGSAVDIATNLTGAVLGVLVGRHWRTLLMPNARARAALALGAAVVFLAVIGVTSIALTPSLTPLPWYSNRSAGTMLRPSGRVLDVRVAGEPLVDDYVRNGGAVRAGLLAGEPVVVTAVVARDASQSTHLVQVIDGPIDDIVVVSRVHDHAAFSLRNRGRDARLRELAVRLTGLFHGPGTDTVRVTGAWRQGYLVIAGQRGRTVREYALPLTASLGWALLLPVNGGVGPAFMPVSAAWLAILLLPFAYWSALAARAGSAAFRWRALQAVVIGAALLVPSWVLPLAPPRWWEWAVALATMAAVETAVVWVGGRRDLRQNQPYDELQPAPF